MSAADTGAEIVQVVSALVTAVGPEIVKAIVGHGATNAPIPSDARAQILAILYPAGGSKLASEIEHDVDLAELAAPKPVTA